MADYWVKLDGTNLNGAVDTAETECHLGNTGKVQEVGSGQPQCSARPSARSSGQGNPQHNAGWGIRRWKAVLKRRTWAHWWKKTCTWPGNVGLQARNRAMSWATAKAAWPIGWGRWFCYSTLLWWDPTWSAAPTSELLSIGKRVDLIHLFPVKMIRELEYLSCKERLR